MSNVTRPVLEGSALVHDTVQTAYVDFVLDQTRTLPGGVQNDGPSRDLQMRIPSESTSGVCKAVITGTANDQEDGYMGLC
jgi:hypothetical protein